uniref:protein-serine/threonine phosphatase n=1 Tax=Oryza nivara TaxID=4536 RepID=A0A0E0H095_ORYNI
MGRASDAVNAKKMVDEELFDKSSNDHSISSEEEDMLVRSYSNLNVSFGYHCNSYQCFSLDTDEYDISPNKRLETNTMMTSQNGSFTCLSGAAISANFTLANTNICKGLIGEEILPELDSPNSFRKIVSSPSMSRLDLLSTSQGSPVSTESSIFEISKNIWRSSAPTTVSSNFLTSTEIKMAGGAAGEDRVQAVCSEKNGWLICGIYDGFNGRDAADFLAVTLYDNIVYYLYLLECRIKQENGLYGSPEGSLNGVKSELTLAMRFAENEDVKFSETFRAGVLKCLTTAVEQAENDFLCMVEQEMDDRPDLVSVGSCVLVVLLHGTDLCILNLGDSRAVLASVPSSGMDKLKAVQLTEIHSLENPLEYQKLLADHPNEPSVVMGNKIKGKLKVTRAFGVGYLKQKKLNDALMGILRVRNLCSPPYVYTNPHTVSHKVTEDDLFVVLGSDGLFDFFSNDEVVQLVYQFMHDNPIGDPAKYLIEQLLLKAAKEAALTAEELMRIPVGSRRKYHDDVTVIVIILGNAQRTMTAVGID